ncbi:MAG TPA: peptidase [Bauldia sp.]|nr:peptidase [Bauldia sp.]
MTYCVGILVRDGLVMLADTRTNAGLDNIAVFRKLHIFEDAGERIIGLATAGNLAVTQSVLNLVTEGLTDPETGETETLMGVPSMFRAAQLVGRAIREVRRIDGLSLEQTQATFDVTILVGGQIKGGRLRLFMVYSAGNFIEATADTPYLQVGEHKYGKPILDRSIVSTTNIDDAVKLALVSMDSTMRSNLTVGLPIDLLVVRRDACRAEISQRIDAAEPYFHDLRERWSSALRLAHQSIPPPPYKSR